MSRGVPSRDDGGRGQQLLVVALALGAVLFTAVPAASFTTATVNRGANVDVVGDESGVVGLGVTARLFSCASVSVTNNLGSTVTVTVSLVDNDRAAADLRGPDGERSDSVRFGLNNGETKTVTATDGGRTLGYIIEVTSGPTDFEAQRQSFSGFFCR